jgi:hypothetical protein
MHDPIMSPRLFDIIITVLVSLGVFWVMLDVFFITRLRGKDMKDATNRDKLFGYLIGITIITAWCNRRDDVPSARVRDAAPAPDRARAR